MYVLHTGIFIIQTIAICEVKFINDFKECTSFPSRQSLPCRSFAVPYFKENATNLAVADRWCVSCALKVTTVKVGLNYGLRARDRAATIK